MCYGSSQFRVQVLFILIIIMSQPSSIQCIQLLLKLLYDLLTWPDQQLADNQAKMEAASRFHGLGPNSTSRVDWAPTSRYFTHRHHTCVR